MSNAETSTNESDDDATVSKQSRTDGSFRCAFGNLKRSEFFEKPSTSKLETCTTATASRSNAVLVSPKQKGNPLLKFLTNVSWQYSDIVPDYVMGKTTCALFLSLRYHQLNPDYIHDRLKLLGTAYNLRVLLVQVDIADPHHALKHLTRISILADMTIMLAWNAEDAGKIIETYKMYEIKPPDDIMERSDTALCQKLISALTTVRFVNKTDAMTLLKNFGTLANIVNASLDRLVVCPGFGRNKANKLYRVLHETFLRTPSVRR